MAVLISIVFNYCSSVYKPKWFLVTIPSNIQVILVVCYIIIFNYNLTTNKYYFLYKYKLSKFQQ